MYYGKGESSHYKIKSQFRSSEYLDKTDRVNSHVKAITKNMFQSVHILFKVLKGIYVVIVQHLLKASYLFFATICFHQFFVVTIQFISFSVCLY